MVLAPDEDSIRYLELSSQVLKGLILSNLSQKITSNLSIIIKTTKIKILNSRALKLNNKEIYFTKFVTNLQTTDIMRTVCEEHAALMLSPLFLDWRSILPVP